MRCCWENPLILVETPEKKLGPKCSSYLNYVSLNTKPISTILVTLVEN